MFNIDWRSESDSLTRTRSSANMGDPQKIPLILTPCLDEERCSRRSLTNMLYSKGERTAPWRTPWRIGKEREMEEFQSTAEVLQLYQSRRMDQM